MTTCPDTLSPVEAARRATMRPTPDGRAPLVLRGHRVLANLHPLHPRSLGAAVYDSSHARRVRGQTTPDGRPMIERVTRWTVVDAVRAPDGRRVIWLTAEIYPTPPTTPTPEAP